MRLLQSSLFFLSFLVLAVLIQPPTAVWGQCAYRDVVTGTLLATYDGSAMQVQLDLKHGLWWPGTSRGNAVAFDVYRRTLGYECGPEVRITDKPIPWPTECEPFVANLTDPDVSLDTAYEYQARPVDAERNPAVPAVGQNVDPFLTYGVAGTALLAHGYLDQGDNFRMFVGACPSECFGGGMLAWPSTGEPPLDRQAPVVVYGDGVGVTYYSNGWATTLFATSVRNSGCVISVESVGWGAVKRLYE